MSAFPLTRRAALAALGAFALPGHRRSKRAGAAQRPVPRHSRRRLAASRLHGRSDGGLGAAGASRRARASPGWLHGARRPPRRDSGGADRRPLSRAEQRRRRPVGRFAGHDQRHAAGQGPARGDRRQRAHPGDRLVPPDGRRPAYARRIRTIGGSWLWRRRSRAGPRGSSGSRSSLRGVLANRPKTAPNGLPLRGEETNADQRRHPSLRHWKPWDLRSSFGARSGGRWPILPSGSARSGSTLRRSGRAPATRRPTGWSRSFQEI